MQNQGGKMTGKTPLYRASMKPQPAEAQPLYLHGVSNERDTSEWAADPIRRWFMGSHVECPEASNRSAVTVLS